MEKFGEYMIKKVLDKTGKHFEYLSELLEIKDLTEKEQNDLFRFGDILSAIEHNEGNEFAKKIIEKLEKYNHLGLHAIKAKLNIFLSTNYEVDLTKLPLDRQIEYNVFLSCR